MQRDDLREQPTSPGAIWVAIGRTAAAVAATTLTSVALTRALERWHGGNTDLAILLAAPPAIILGALAAFGSSDWFRHSRRGRAAGRNEVPEPRSSVGPSVRFDSDRVSISIAPTTFREYYEGLMAWYQGRGPEVRFPGDADGVARESSPLAGSGIGLDVLAPMLDYSLPRFTSVTDSSSGFGAYNVRFDRLPAWGLHEGEALFAHLGEAGVIDGIELQLRGIDPRRRALWLEALASLQRLTDLMLVDTDQGLIVRLDDRDGLEAYLARVSARSPTGPDSPTASQRVSGSGDDAAPGRNPMIIAPTHADPPNIAAPSPIAAPDPRPDCLPILHMWSPEGEVRRDAADLDRLFSPGSWSVGYSAGDRAMGREEALDLYVKSYAAHFERYPHLAKQLGAGPRAGPEIDATSPPHPDHAACGLPAIPDSELPGAAIELALEALGLEAAGDLPEKTDRIAELGPGHVPFCAPELILEDRECVAEWIQRGSVEDFWRNNQFGFLRCSPEVLDRLRASVDSDLGRGREQDWEALGERLAALVICGRSNGTRVAAYVESLRSRTRDSCGEDSGPSDHSLDDWFSRVIRMLRCALTIRNLETERVLEICDQLLPAILGADPGMVSYSLATCGEPRLRAGALCALMNGLAHPYWGNLEVLGVLLSDAEALDRFERDPACRRYVARSRILGLSPEDVERKILSQTPAKPETKQRFLQILYRPLKPPGPPEFMG